MVVPAQVRHGLVAPPDLATIARVAFNRPFDPVWFVSHRCPGRLQPALRSCGGSFGFGVIEPPDAPMPIPDAFIV